MLEIKAFFKLFYLFTYYFTRFGGFACFGGFVSVVSFGSFRSFRWFRFGGFVSLFRVLVHASTNTVPQMVLSHVITSFRLHWNVHILKSIEELIIELLFTCRFLCLFKAVKNSPISLTWMINCWLMFSSNWPPLRLCTALSDCLLTPFERAKAKQYKTAQVTLFFPNSKHDYDRRDFHSHLPARTRKDWWTVTRTDQASAGKYWRKRKSRVARDWWKNYQVCSHWLNNDAWFL